jgi:hypothetical protein
MTCEDIRTHIESTAKVTELVPDSGVAAHIASCAECRQFMQEQQSLGTSLQLVRESVSSVPESLDAAVLAGYRRFIAEREAIPRGHMRKAHFPLVLRWGAVAALVLLASGIAWYSRKPTRVNVIPPVQPASTVAAVAPRTESAEPQVWPAKRLVSPARKHSAPSDVHRASAVASIPDDFRGLMYCDQLSCAGAMDVIRVQLPPSAIARPTSLFRQTGGPVNADVLIGADGIARGIRIEGREF